MKLQKANGSELNPIFIKNIRQWFVTYAASFYTSDSNCQQRILLKRNHSLRVSALAGRIAKQLQLSDVGIVPAKIIGLLHDVGRFELFTRYQPFVDRYCFDHGDYGAQLLKANKFIRSLPSSLRETIECAIACHNKVGIPSQLKGKPLLHARIVRDAGKLDNLRITLNQLKKQAPAPMNRRAAEENGLSDEMLRALLNKELIDYATIKHPLDFHLVKIAWVYDLNHSPIFSNRQGTRISVGHTPDTPRHRCHPYGLPADRCPHRSAAAFANHCRPLAGYSRSALAAKMKSLSVSPSILWVKTVRSTFPQLK